jgi:hypothetical protein
MIHSERACLPDIRSGGRPHFKMQRFNFGLSPILAMGFTLVLASPLRGQQADGPTQTPKALCFRGRPFPLCRSFLLTEFDLALTDGSTRWELGAMHNVGSRSALGGSLLLRGEDRDSSAFGVTARYRRWVSRVVALDLSSGILVAGPGAAPGFAGHVGLGVGDLIGLSIEAETVAPDLEGGKRIRWFGGVRLGAHAGTIVGLLAGILAYGCSGGCVTD